MLDSQGVEAQSKGVDLLPVVGNCTSEAHIFFACLLELNLKKGYGCLKTHANGTNVGNQASSTLHGRRARN